MNSPKARAVDKRIEFGGFPIQEGAVPASIADLTETSAFKADRVETPFEAFIRQRHEANQLDGSQRNDSGRRDRWTRSLV